jgi:uncharacterized protein (TIGR02145 family)
VKANSKPIIYLICSIYSLLVYSCKNEVENPIIETTEIKLITTTSAYCGCKITKNGSSTILYFGICWSNKVFPTTSDFKNLGNNDELKMEAKLEYLLPNTAYHVRAFVTTSDGSFYGDENIFTTCDSIVADIEGNQYHTVTIGNQVWMAENLKTTRLNDGTILPNITDGTSWGFLTTPAYCSYLNNPRNLKEYGALYNWFAVNTKKLCPSGWHVPSDEEWTALELYLQNNGYNYNGIIDSDSDRLTNNNIAISLALKGHWGLSTIEGTIGYSENSVTRNLSGFSALPGGMRHGQHTWGNMGTFGYWRSSTEGTDLQAWYRSLSYKRSNLLRDLVGKSDGMSVRCMKD